MTASLLDQRKPHVEYTLYTRRWYILLVLSLVVGCQNAFWNTFGALEPFVITHYSTTKSMVNFLSALGPIVFIPTAFVSVWFVDRFGLRKTMITSAFLCCFGGIIRCIYVEHFAYNIIFPIIGQSLNNAVGPVSMIVQPKVSSIWFGPSERTLATSIGFQANVAGLAGSYLLSLLVHDSSQVPHLLYIYAAFGILPVILTVLYFPDKPPTPPSVTGEMSGSVNDNSPLTVLRNSYQSLTNPTAFILIVFGSCPSGVYSAWCAMILEIVTPLGYTPDQGEWFGFWAMVAGGLGGVLLGKLHDYYKHYKPLLIGLYVSVLAIFVWFTLTMASLLPGAYIVAQVGNIIGGFLISCPSGILYEGIVESTYPIPEQTGVNLYAVLFNLWALVFLFAGDYISPTVMNWTLCGSTLLTIVAMLPLKEKYTRSSLDSGYMPILQ